MILGDTRLLQVDLRSVLGTWLLANCSTNLGQLQEHWPLRALGLRVWFRAVSILLCSGGQNSLSKKKTQPLA